MNERIRELALEAFEPINNIATEGVADRHTFDQAWFQLYNHRFAMLIIQECVDQCEQAVADADKKANSPLVTDAGRMLYEGMWGGAMNCSAQIREHFFGVEE
jgi:hypothetical protein